MNAKSGNKASVWIWFYGFIFLFGLLMLCCGTNEMAFAKEKSPDPWSNEILWKQLIDNQTRATFSVKINNSLPKFTFTIHGKFKYSKQPQGNFFHPSYIEIKDPSNAKTIQKIENKGNFDNNGDGYDRLDLEFADFVQMVDLNQDGYLDLRILRNTGATGNNWYATFLYHPDIGQFKYHKALSRLSAVTVDHKSKLIKTYWRKGGCDEFREYFSLGKNGILILEKIEWTELDNTMEEPGCLKFTAIPRDTRMLDRLGETFYRGDDKFAKILRTKLIVVRKEDLRENLDGKKRGILGTPVDRKPMSP